MCALHRLRETASYSIHLSVRLRGLWRQVRRILLNLAENADLFGGEVPARLRKPWHLTTPVIAAMDEDKSLTLSTVGDRLITIFGLSPSQCPFSTRRQVRQSSLRSVAPVLGRSGTRSDIHEAALAAKFSSAWAANDVLTFCFPTSRCSG